MNDSHTLSELLISLPLITDKSTLDGYRYGQIFLILTPEILSVLDNLGYTEYPKSSPKSYIHTSDPLFHLIPAAMKDDIALPLKLYAVSSSTLVTGSLILSNVEEIKQFLILCNILPTPVNQLLTEPTIELLKSFKSLVYVPTYYYVQGH